MNTWNLFTNSDLIVAIIGAVGLLSAFVVVRTAMTNVFSREAVIRAQRVGNLTPEDNVLEDTLVD